MNRVRTQIVVPCYNEEHRLPSTQFDAYLASEPQVGFVFVNDGSKDRTLEVLRSLQSRWSDRVQIVDLATNVGKAEAVRTGLSHAQTDAEYVGYFDADLATPLGAVAAFVETLDRLPDIDMVLGARVALLGREIQRSAHRHYLGRVFATAASLVLGIAIYDTQCGAKLFRARQPLLSRLFDRPFGSRWIFDVEIIARYMTEKGGSAGIYELPLWKWTDVGQSTVRPKDFLRAVGEMAAIYREYRLPRHMSLLLALLSSPLVRYAAAGAVGTAGHYGVLVGLVSLLHFSPVPATAIGALVGAAINYLLNYHLTFASTRPHRQALPRFMMVAALSAGLNAAGMRYALLWFNVKYLAAQVVCTAVIMLIGFVLNRVWTFGSGRLRARGTTRRPQATHPPITTDPAPDVPERLLP